MERIEAIHIQLNMESILKLSSSGMDFWWLCLTQSHLRTFAGSCQVEREERRDLKRSRALS